MRRIIITASGRQVVAFDAPTGHVDFSGEDEALVARAYRASSAFLVNDPRPPGVFIEDWFAWHCGLVAARLQGRAGPPSEPLPPATPGVIY
jgi:hypothetical protein